MTDIVAVMFLIGVACLFSILVFVFRHSMLTVISGIIWAVLSVYLFSRSYSGDPDAGIVTWAFGWICVALTIVFWTAPLWLLKMKLEDKPIEKKDFYTDMKERADKIREMRPKKRRRDPFWEE